MLFLLQFWHYYVSTPGEIIICCVSSSNFVLSITFYFYRTHKSIKKTSKNLWTWPWLGLNRSRGKVPVVNIHVEDSGRNTDWKWDFKRKGEWENPVVFVPVPSPFVRSGSIRSPPIFWLGNFLFNGWWGKSPNLSDLIFVFRVLLSWLYRLYKRPRNRSLWRCSRTLTFVLPVFIQDV